MDIVLEDALDYSRFATLEPALPSFRDEFLFAWRCELSSLASSQFTIREAKATAEDARRMWDIQLLCQPITPLPLTKNIETITDHLVLVAEINGVHVGFCTSSQGPREIDPLFTQVVAVVPEAQRRGIGLSLLTAAAAREPKRDIVLATHPSNIAAHAMNARFAESIGANIRRVNLGVYPDRFLGIQRGQGYRAWQISRP